MNKTGAQRPSKAEKKRAKKAKRRSAALDASQDGREGDATSTAPDKPPGESRTLAVHESIQLDMSASLAKLFADAPRTSSLIQSLDAACPFNIKDLFDLFRLQLAAAARRCIPSCRLLRRLMCICVCGVVDLDTLQKASREGRLDACVKAVRQMAEQMASEAHLQRLLSVKMWRFLVILIEDIADQLEADFPLFIETIESLRRPAVAESLSTTTAAAAATTTAPGSVHLPVFPPDIDPVQLVLQHSPSTYHRFVEARLLPSDRLTRLLELFRVDKGPSDMRDDSYTWDRFLDEYVAADCALSEGEGHKRLGSFTVSGASGSLAALNGSYVIRPTEDEQVTLVASPDGALAYVGEKVVFERLVCPTNEAVFDETRVVWVAYEPATAQQPTPRLLVVGLGDADMPGAAFAAHPGFSSPAFETHQWYTVDEGAQLVPVDFSVSAAIPLDSYVCRSTIDPMSRKVVADLRHFQAVSFICRAISDSADSLVEGPGTQLVAYYVSPYVMESLPPSAHNPEPLTGVASERRPTARPMGERPLNLRDSEKAIRQLGLMRLSDEWSTRPFAEWPQAALLQFLGNGGMVGGRLEGARVAVVRPEVLVSGRCALCDVQPPVSTLGDMPLLHSPSLVSAHQDLAYLSTGGVWTLRAFSQELVCGKCSCAEAKGTTSHVLGLLAALSEGDDASDDGGATETHPAAAAARPSRRDTSDIMVSRDFLLDILRPASPSAASGQGDSDLEETTRGQAATPAGTDEESTGTPQAAVAASEASGSVSIEWAFGSTQYLRGLLAREGPWECGVDLRALFEGLAQKLKDLDLDIAFGPLFRLRRIIVRQVLECLQLDQLSEALSRGGSNRPLEETAASLHREAKLIKGDETRQTLCSRYLWYTMVYALEAIVRQIEADGVAFVRTMQDIRRRIQDQDFSGAADAILPPLPFAGDRTAGDNFNDFARQVVVALVQQGPPDFSYLEPHLQTYMTGFAPSDRLLDLQWFFRLHQGPLKSPSQHDTEDSFYFEWHVTYRDYLHQCGSTAATGGRRHGSFTVSGAPVINGTYLLRPTEQEQETLLYIHPEAVAYVGEDLAFERLVYPQADGSMGGFWIACTPDFGDTIGPLCAFAPFKNDAVSGYNPLLSHPAAANPAFETSEWFTADQEGRISRLDGVKMSSTLPLTFDVPRSVIPGVSKVEGTVEVDVYPRADTAEPLACESLDDYYTHHLAKLEVSKGAAFPMAFYLDANVMEQLPRSARHTERLTGAGQSPAGYTSVSTAETMVIKRGMVRLAEEYVTKAFTEWPFAAVVALLATGWEAAGGLVCVLRAESRTQTCSRCGKPCAGSSGGPVDTIPLVHTLTCDDLMDDAMIEEHKKYIRGAGAELCVWGAGGRPTCGACQLDCVESLAKEPSRPATPADVLDVFSRLMSSPSETEAVPTPQPKSASSSSTPSRASPAAPGSIFRGIFTPKDKTTKPKPPKSTPFTPQPKPTSTQPPTTAQHHHTITVESIRSAFPDIATVRSATEGDKQPPSETLAVVKAFLQCRGGATEGGGESSQCDATQERETYLRAVKKFFMDHRTALQSDPSAVFPLGPLRHVRGEWLPQWHTTFVSELSKGQQLMQKELGAATTRGPTDGNNASATAIAADDMGSGESSPLPSPTAHRVSPQMAGEAFPSVMRLPYGGRASTGGARDAGKEVADKCARLEKQLATAEEQVKTAVDAHTTEKNELNQNIERLQDDVKRLTDELSASKRTAKKERKAADAQRSTLEDLIKDKDKEIKQAQKTADDRVRRVSQQVREEADKAAKTHMDTVTKQHEEELDRLRGEHRSAILEVRAQHRTAIEQRETEVRCEAERALGDMTRERDQLRQRLREERLRSARVDQEKDTELRRLREAEAPLRRENLMLKQQLSAQPPHSRLSGDGVSSMELPSVRQLLDDLVSEQGRLTQLHQTAIERQIQLLHHPQSSHASSSSSAAAAANPPNHTTAPSVPLSLSMDDANASPAAAAAGGSSSAQRNAPCAASSSSSGGGGGGSSAARCSVCLVNPTNVILLPCGHKVVCQDCFEKWMAPMPAQDKLCPEHTCRQPYFEVKYVF